MTIQSYSSVFRLAHNSIHDSSEAYIYCYLQHGGASASTIADKESDLDVTPCVACWRVVRRPWRNGRKVLRHVPDSGLFSSV